MNSVTMRMKLRLSMTASLSCGCELVMLRSGRRDFAMPLVARPRKQRVDDGDENRTGCERPENAVGREEPVVDVPAAERDERGEEDPSRARVGRGLRIGNHEEGEEQQRAALQPVNGNHQRLADPERTSDDERAPENDEGICDVAACRAVDD